MHRAERFCSTPEDRMQLRAPVARPVDVLIASTHEWTSRSLASILAPHGYVFYRAYNRAQTLKRIRSNPPDAIIVDEQLPDGDGYTLCRELNEENLVSPSTPVFLALPRADATRPACSAASERMGLLGRSAG